jgi:hypothetical protein
MFAVATSGCAASIELAASSDPDEWSESGTHAALMKSDTVSVISG